MDWRAVGLVSAGAVLGALARFGLSTAMPTKAFPWATLTVNLLGALAIGALMLPEPAGRGARLLLVVGFLGSFTTLSAYAFETVDLWRSGRVPLAVVNMVANGLGGPLLALAGWRLKLALS